MGLQAVAAAYDLAARVHADQRRKGAGANPYVNHPCEVALMVAQAGGDETACLAAVLHDVVEDSDVTVDAIAESFGAPVAELVDWLTSPPDLDALPTPEKKARQAAHIRGAPPAARVIKLADQTSNLLGRLDALDASRLARTRAYLHGAIAVAAACRDISPALDEAFDAAARRLAAALDAAEPVASDRKDPRA